LKMDELSMYGKHGGMMSKGYRFIAVVCQECGFTEFSYKEKSSWI
jgi:predicted nucleic-acid-binding Zn-ribbon protein